MTDTSHGEHTENDLPQASVLRCAECGYDLTGTAVGGRCPECGLDVTRSLATSELLNPPNVPRGYKVSAKTIICPNPNCAYRGKAICKPKGSIIILILLLLLWIIPGLLYFIFCYGHTYACPQCSTEVKLG